VAILSTAQDGAPYAIPVSTAVRAGENRIVFALARSRGSYARLRTEPRCTLTLVCAEDLAFTAHGRASVLREALPGADAVAAVALEVDELRTHGDPRFSIDDGVRWHWADPDAAARDSAVHDALAALARHDAPPGG
jgi:flavin reductase (DIM6/NTAB) family NADH-FMN oxidoreductase RutF